MLPPWVIFLSVAVAARHGSRSPAEPQCYAPISKTMEFSLEKDTTGQWVAEVELSPGTSDQDTSAWEIDLQQTTVDCPGSPKVKMTVKLPAERRISPYAGTHTRHVDSRHPPRSPSPGYELHRGLGYYKIYSHKKNWQEAKETCEADGAHLAIINSEVEASLLKELFSRIGGGTWLYVGFHDKYLEGQYLTVFDEPLETTGFTRWTANQPDNAGGSATNPGEDCGTIHRRDAGLNDLWCHWTAPFVCEIELESQANHSLHLRPCPRV